MNQDMTDTKFCHKCQTNKPRSEFGPHSGRADGLQTQCRTCIGGYTVDLGRIRNNNDIARHRNKIWLGEQLQKCTCSECGKKKPAQQMRMLQGATKYRHGLSVAIKNACAIAFLEKEMAHCRPACDDCYLEQQALKNPDYFHGYAATHDKRFLKNGGIPRRKYARVGRPSRKEQAQAQREALEKGFGNDLTRSAAIITVQRKIEAKRRKRASA